MKILITTTFLFFVIFLAQASGKEDILRNQASDMARRMANQIELNESSYIQVRNFTFEKLVAAEEIKEMYSYDVDMMQRKLAEIDQAYTLRIQNILTNKQFESYAVLAKSFKSEIFTIAVTE